MTCCANGTCTVPNCPVCTVKDRFVWVPRTKSAGEPKMTRQDTVEAKDQRKWDEWEEAARE